MEIGTENCNITEWKMAKKKKKLLNGTQSWVQDIGPTERSVDQGKDGKMTSTISSNELWRKKEKDEPIERKIQNKKIWINTAKDWNEWARLEEKYTMKCVKWQKKEKNRRGPWTKQQQHSDQWHCDGQRSSSTAVMSIVKVDKQWSRSKWRVLDKKEEFTYERCSYQRTKVGTYSRNDCCIVVSCRPPSWCFRFSWSPGLLLPASWLPAFFLFCLWCCSESEDSAINLWIQHSNCLWYLFVFFPCTLSPSQVPLRYNLSSNSLYLHTLPMSKLHQQNRFFFVVSWPRHSCL